MSIESKLNQLRKKFGEGIVMLLSDAPVQVAAIPTGSLALDLALQVGGIPRGRITEIYGPEAAGKTTLAASIMAQAQKQGGTALYIDMEHTADINYMAACGVDKKALLFSQPDSGEAAFTVLEAMLPEVDVIVVDSVPSLVTQRELDAEPADQHMGVLARFLSQRLRSIMPKLGQSNCALIFINQIRMKLGTMYGNPETTPGGLAMKYYASVRIDLRRKDTLKDRGAVVGQTVRAKIVKSKVGMPHLEATFEIIYGKGISAAGDVLTVCSQMGIITGGSYYRYGDIMLGHGREAARKYLEAHPELVEELRQAALSRAASLPMAASDEEEEEETEGLCVQPQMLF